jgi:hypothetical protein
MKILTTIMRVLWGLVLLLPILGAAHVFPDPTPDLYSPAGWAFMQALMNAGYMMPLLGLTFFVALIFIILNRTAIAAIIILPVLVNILCFHLFVDNSFFTFSASLAWVLLICTAYFLWINREKYKTLW